MNAASNWIERKKNIQLTKGVTYVLQNQKDSAEKTEHLNFIQRSSLNRTNLFKERIRDLWLNYTEPIESVASLMSRYESERAANNIQDGRQIIKDLKDVYVIKDNAYYAVDFYTGTMIEENPIMHDNPPDFYEVEGTLVSISTTSNTVHVLDTLENIISRASEKGWPKKHISEMLLRFVHSYLPMLSGAVFARKDAMHVLDTILNSVSFHHLTRKLKMAMTNLVRTPDQPISNVMLSYTSLLCEAAKLEDPSYDEHRAKEKAEKQACRTVRFFLEPALASQMEDLRKEFRLHFEKDMSLQDIIEFVDEAECETQYQLRSPRGLKQQPFPMSIYNNQVNRVVNVDDSQGVSVNAIQRSPVQRQRTEFEKLNQSLSEKAHDANSTFTKGDDELITEHANDMYGLRQNTKLPNKYGGGPNPLARGRSQFRPGTSSTPYGGARAKETPGSKFRSRTPSWEADIWNSPKASNSFKDRRPFERSKSPTSKRTESPIYANAPRPRSSSPSARDNKMRNGSVTYRSRSGNIRRISGTRILRRSTSRDTRQQSKSPASNSRAGVKAGCRLCGQKNHSTPGPFNVASCPMYDRATVTRQPCTNCGKGLYHPHWLCKQGRPVSLSRANSPSFRPPTPNQKN